MEDLPFLGYVAPIANGYGLVKDQRMQMKIIDAETAAHETEFFASSRTLAQIPTWPVRTV